MSGRNVFIAISLVFGIWFVAGCSKESPVVEKKFARLGVSAFTVEPYRFRVVLSDEILTDSLVTLDEQKEEEVMFTDYRQRIRIYNTADESLLIDTFYTMIIGKLNAFSIYQSKAGTTPFYLTPSSAEPLPESGKTKLKVICSGDRLPDSFRVVSEFTNDRITTKDTVVAYKNDFTKYFNVAKSASVKVSLIRTNNNQSLGNLTFRPNDLNPDFTIYRLINIGTTSLSSIKLY